MNSNASPAEYLSTTEAAHRAGVTPRTIRNWTRHWIGLGRRIGGRWRIDESELRRALTADHAPQIPFEEAAAMMGDNLPRFEERVRGMPRLLHKSKGRTVNAEMLRRLRDFVETQTVLAQGGGFRF